MIMSIRAKAMAIIIGAVLILLVLIFGFSKLIWEGNIDKQETSIINDKLAQVEKLINNECASINLSVSDWAIFNDSYNFIKKPSKIYIDANLQDVTFSSLRMNYIIYLDKNGGIVYEKGYDLEKLESMNVPKEVHHYLTKDKMILKNISVSKTVFGLIPVKDKMLMVAANPISTSDGKSAMNGTLVMARYITEDNMKFIQELTKSRIRIYNIDNRDYLGNNRKMIQKAVAMTGFDTNIEKLNDKFLIGYKKLMDIDKHPTMLLGVEINRDVYHNGKKAQQIFVICLLVSIFAVFGLFVILIQKTVIRKIENLNSFVKGVIFSEDIDKTISMKGTDEISSLSCEINKMLGRINSAENKIKEKEKQLEMVLEGSTDGFWDWNMNDKTIMFSESALNMVEYSAGDLGNQQDILLKLTHRDDLDGVNEALNRTISGASNYYGRENRLLTKSGIWKWFLIRGKIVDYNTDGTPKRMAGTITDISDRKKTEEEIRFLSYNDKLTGLFNRAYFEKEMNYVDTTSSLPFTFIIGDLNGLKLANDVFGHDEGDRLLIEIAKIIKKSCRETDVISRWGGDEFAILLIGTDEKNARIVCDRIHDNCIRSESGYIKPSIALGLATKTRQSEDITKLMREAEAAMYKNKMQEGKLVRTRILDSLRLELEAKSYENSSHYKLIRELSIKFGEQLNLSVEEIDKLQLLCEYHDLGEITISEGILKKQGELDSADWEEIKKHPETGYRIAKAIPEISHIADNIVKHHERFDGSGYPYGIKGTEIPILSRMFSIIDAYASMTQDISYRIPKSSSEALEELKNCASTWFDPILVDEFKNCFNVPK